MRKKTFFVLAMLMIGVMVYSSCARNTCPAYRGAATSHPTGPRK